VTDLLAYPEPPGEAELAPVVAAQGPQRVVERNAMVVDPEIPPQDRLLTGARLIAGNQGADREPYQAWQVDRSQPSPPRAGTNPRQAAVLAAPDNLVRGKALGSESAAAWLEATQADPIDVARFDRAVKTGRAGELWDKMKAGALADDDEAFQLADRVAKVGQILENFDDDLSLGAGRVVDIGERVRVHWDGEPAPGVLTALSMDSMPLDGFDGDTDTGFDVSVGDDMVVSAPVESQTTLRRAFPAASTGGTPRWLSVQPTVVRGLLRAVESAGVDPSANVAVHLAGHPGMAPYDSIAFTTEKYKRADRFRALGAEHLGRGLIAAPRFKRRPVAVDELVDASTADKFVDELAWAIFDDQRDGIPVRSGGKDYTMVPTRQRKPPAGSPTRTMASLSNPVTTDSSPTRMSPAGSSSSSVTVTPTSSRRLRTKPCCGPNGSSSQWTGGRFPSTTWTVAGCPVWRRIWRCWMRTMLLRM
jgi:hypothetical protein